MYQVKVSETFQKQYNNENKKLQKRIKDKLEYLKADPFTPRSGADILPVKGTKPQKYRLRVGDYRIIYSVREDIVEVIEMFPRGKGYSEQ